MVVQQWITLFTGKTFQPYANHLLKACHLLQLDTSWRDEGAEAIIIGLANKHPARNRFFLTPYRLSG